ncbi:WD40 repeat-like protein [Fomitiporia mediterranea MF3/22]|uniref:WD40 repeat-like protein n=1 Tax=Fomitiporia mediterranea (strain MF3/22) TaxID=694068 RepID=UPI0004407F83|nr:WD40 repeat-like protein [Fomitiporia mediterranea MF3/22]EJC99734.1 WD40 repeat-like protein [Fomitiporia mediterranea MF3/22]
MGKVVFDTSARHTELVLSVAFSPDGSQIVSGSVDKSVRLWDANTGEVISSPFEGHGHFVNSVAFSPDGKRIVSGSRDESVIIWDVNDGEMVFRLCKGHADRVTSVVFSPDGTRIVSGSSDRTIIVWNAENRDIISRSEQLHKSAIWTVAFSPDGTFIASASVENDVIIWIAESWKRVSGPFKASKDSTEQYFAPLAFSPDGRRVASRDSDDNIIIRDVQTGHIESGPMEGHSDIVPSVAFSPDGAYLVSGSYDRMVIVWDASNGSIVSEPYKGHTSPITCVAFSLDSSRIVSCSYDATIRIWNVLGKEGYSSMTRGVPDNVVASYSSTQDVNEGFVRWKLSDNGWVLSPQGELLLWLPPDIRPTLWQPQNTTVFSCEFSTKLNFKDVAHGQRWQECFNPDRFGSRNKSTNRIEPLDLRSAARAAYLPQDFPSLQVMVSFCNCIGCEPSFPHIQMQAKDAHRTYGPDSSSAFFIFSARESRHLGTMQHSALPNHIVLFDRQSRISEPDLATSSASLWNDRFSGRALRRRTWKWNIARGMSTKLVTGPVVVGRAYKIESAISVNVSVSDGRSA